MNATRRPGQPLTALTAVLGAWVIVRIVLWQAPLPLGQAMARSAEVSRATATAIVQKTKAQSAEAFAPAAPVALSKAWPGQASAAWAPSANRRHAPVAPAVAAAITAPPAPQESLIAFLPPRAAVSPQPLASPLVRAPVAQVPRGLARWSGGGWLLLRGGAAGALTTGPGVGRYGGSQAGAVLSYALSASERRPALHARVTSALHGVADRQLAVGASARPLAAFPVRAQLELRAIDSEAGVRFAPAAMAISELPRFDLPVGFRAEAYLQAGYVGGALGTPYVGGDARVDRPLVDFGPGRLRLGAGAWGGAQEGAAALDVGPGLTLESELAGIPAKLSLDYRLRVAGEAEPRSGLALTLSTGF